MFEIEVIAGAVGAVGGFTLGTLSWCAVIFPALYPAADSQHCGEQDIFGGLYALTTGAAGATAGVGIAGMLLGTQGNLVTAFLGALVGEIVGSLAGVGVSQFLLPSADPLLVTILSVSTAILSTGLGAAIGYNLYNWLTSEAR